MGSADGRYAFYVKIHHTVMDGVAGFQMITDALSPDPKRRSMPHFYAAQRREQDARTTRESLQLPNPFPMLRSVAGTAASGVALARASRHR